MYLSLPVVLEIAQGIERKGIEIYQQMKDRFDDPLLDYLIAQEKEHIRVFHDLFARAPSASTKETIEIPHLDEDYLAAAYANTEIFGQVKPAHVPAKDLFPMAVVMEKESIRFYLELLAEIPEQFHEQRTLVHRIAGEERQHLRKLLARKQTFVG